MRNKTLTFYEFLTKSVNKKCALVKNGQIYIWCVHLLNETLFAELFPQLTAVINEFFETASIYFAVGIHTFIQ